MSRRNQDRQYLAILERKAADCHLCRGSRKHLHVLSQPVQQRDKSCPSITMRNRANAAWRSFHVTATRWSATAFVMLAKGTPDSVSRNGKPRRSALT